MHDTALTNKRFWLLCLLNRLCSPTNGTPFGLALSDKPSALAEAQRQPLPWSGYAAKGMRRYSHHIEIESDTI